MEASREIVIEHEAGLHARPAALFVKAASGFTSSITVSAKGKTANAKSILQVLTLGAYQGSAITIAANGPDAHEAVDALITLIERNFATE